MSTEVMDRLTRGRELCETGIKADFPPVVKSDPSVGALHVGVPTQFYALPGPARPTCESPAAQCPFVPSVGIRVGDLQGKRPGGVG